MTTSNFANFADLTCDQFADALADFLEREVSDSMRAAVEAHALGCTTCGPLLADLRKLRMDAAALPPLEPSRDLWRGIAGRIEAPVVELPAARRLGGSAARRWSGRTKAGLAAAALIAITATITHEITKRSIPVTPIAELPVVVKPAATSAPATSPETAASAVAAVPAESPSRPVAEPPSRRGAEPPSRLVSNSKPSVEETYASEIKRLRVIVNERRGGLDSTTVAVIDKNLKIIDEAIANCRAALKKDPNSRFLSESLNDALDTKVQLLRTAAALPTRM
jgi:hypothetical protein